MIILSIKCYRGTFGLCRDIPLMKVSVGRDSKNSLKIVTVPLKSGLLATMKELSRNQTVLNRLQCSSLGVHLKVSLGYEKTQRKSWRKLTEHQSTATKSHEYYT